MTRVLLLKNRTTPDDAYEQNFLSKEFDPVFIPLIKHTHLPAQALQLFQNDEYLSSLQNIIITSQRTVECLNESIMPLLSEKQLFELRNKTVYTVGPATQVFLQRCGFTDVRGGPDAGNGDILASLIISELFGSGNSNSLEYPELLFLVGETRRDIIPKKLNEAGLKVQEIVTYKTESLSDNLGRFKFYCTPFCWVVFFSSQGTEEIVKYLKNHPDSKIASIGPTTDRYLLTKGLKSNLVSSKPEPLSLINAMIDFKDTHNDT
ncbi:LAFE_0E06172g1_1 [Lachancea fermentati]|uniref:LAFE_0E06172g1_1 n=1 Tax=Lachancea fermentati TaxID=4955 RepID=A0A1G4MDG3_LACFM|nr:LAFE_0E06172g1_1 [Lachancea fermentati]